jgi:hypothetical protein
LNIDFANHLALVAVVPAIVVGVGLLAVLRTGT